MLNCPMVEKSKLGAKPCSWNVAGCRNCQDHLDENLFIAIDKKTMETLKDNNDYKENIKFQVQIQSRQFGGDELREPVREPVVEFL